MSISCPADRVHLSLLGDEAEVHRPPSALENRLEDAVVARRVGAGEALAVQAADARADAHARGLGGAGSSHELAERAGIRAAKMEIPVETAMTQPYSRSSLVGKLGCSRLLEGAEERPGGSRRLTPATQP